MFEQLKDLFNKIRSTEELMTITHSLKKSTTSSARTTEPSVSLATQARTC